MKDTHLKRIKETLIQLYGFRTMNEETLTTSCRSNMSDENRNYFIKRLKEIQIEINVLESILDDDELNDFKVKYKIS